MIFDQNGKELIAHAHSHVLHREREREKEREIFASLIHILTHNVTCVHYVPDNDGRSLRLSLRRILKRTST